MINVALERYHVIKPYLKQESSLHVIAKHHGLNVRTLQRWIVRHNKHGLQGLDKCRRSDLGRYRKLTDQAKDLIEGLSLQKQKITIATVTRTLQEYCISNNITPINYHTVRRVVKNIPKDLFTLAKQGDKIYADTYEIVMRRERKYPNQMWQADYCMLDIKVLQSDKEVFPWLTIIMDDFSRAIMGFCLFTGVPSVIQTALALRKAIWYKQDESWPVCGIPEIFYRRISRIVAKKSYSILYE